MDDAKNFVLGIFQTVKERFGNPLVSAFVVAWALWNFRLLLVLIGKGEGGWKAKIEYIDAELMSRWWSWPVHGTVIPLAAALVWIYLLPPLLRKIAAHHEQSTARTREAVFAVTDTRTLSAEEALSMRQMMLRKHSEWISDKQETVRSMERYEEARVELDRQLNVKRMECERLQNELDDLKRPPPRQKRDFQGATTDEKARALGLFFWMEETVTAAKVVFDDRRLRWPWNPNPDQQFEFPHQRIPEGPLLEESAYALIALAVQGIDNKPKHRYEWVQKAREVGVSRPEEVVESMMQNGFFDVKYPVMSMNVNAFAFAAWMKNLGFAIASH